MESIIAQARIQTALRSKLSPENNFPIRPGDDVHVYREKTKRLDGTFKVSKVSDKTISVTDGEMQTPFTSLHYYQWPQLQTVQT